MGAIAVCGGGVAGLAAAMVLARQGHDVTVLERDDAPAPGTPAEAWSDWDRKGVAQIRQFHAYTARTRLILKERLPDVLDALLDAGAAETDIVQQAAALVPGFERQAGDEELVIIRCRRTTLEWTLRQAALREPGVAWRPDVRVLGLSSKDGRVTGVETTDGPMRVDLVVDATGRRSSLPKWLDAAGLAPSHDEAVDTGIVYFTRWYRIPGLAEQGGAGVRLDLDFTRCLLAPADDGHVSLAFMAAADDEPLRALNGEAAFQALAEALPPLAPWITPDRAQPLTKVMFMGGLKNRWRRVDVPGVVPVGDALMCTNPYFGRGVALGLMSVALLADALAAGDMADAAARYAADAADVLEPWYHDGARYDRLRTLWLRAARGEALADEDAAAVDSAETRFHRSVPVAMFQDAEVMRRFMRWLQTLDPPERLTGDPVLREKVLGLVPSAGARPGLPTRDEVLALLTAAPS